MIRSPRPARAGVLLALALTACAAQTPGARTGDPSFLPTDAGSRSSGPSSAHPPSPGASGGTTPTKPGTTPRVTQTGAVYADDGGVGQMARTYLRSSPARALLVEVDWIEGREPTQAALDHLVSILRREADKPGGVRVERGNAIPQRRDSYTFAQIEAVEDANRSRGSAGEVATLYVLYLNGDLAGEEGTIGVAYRASAVALFADRIRAAATALIQPSAIERAVLVHEAGHVLGLINIGYRSKHDHEDASHPHHSRYRTSVMFWAVEDISVSSILSGGPPDDFDRYDRDDLALLRRV